LGGWSGFSAFAAQIESGEEKEGGEAPLVRGDNEYMTHGKSQRKGQKAKNAEGQHGEPSFAKIVVSV
jgi:hypothetical protein